MKAIHYILPGLFHEEKINVGKRPLCRELWMLYKNPITLDFLRL